MKKISKILALPLIGLGLSGCIEQKEPAKDSLEDTTKRIVIDPRAYIRDFDKDGKADALTSKEGLAIYYFPGYEDSIIINDKSRIMPSQMRQSLSSRLSENKQPKYNSKK